MQTLQKNEQTNQKKNQKYKHNEQTGRIKCVPLYCRCLRRGAVDFLTSYFVINAQYIDTAAMILYNKKASQYRCRYHQLVYNNIWQ